MALASELALQSLKFSIAIHIASIAERKHLEADHQQQRHHGRCTQRSR